MSEWREKRCRPREGFWIEILSPGRLQAGENEWAVGEATLWLHGEWARAGKHMLFIPPAARWAQEVPAWAAGKRDLILERVRQRLNPKFYGIQEAEP